MEKVKEKKEEKRKEIREALVCSNCGSAYIYVLVNGKRICRKCGHRNGEGD